jgi:hypothetical protein
MRPENPLPPPPRQAGSVSYKFPPAPLPLPHAALPSSAVATAAKSNEDVQGVPCDLTPPSSPSPSLSPSPSPIERRTAVTFRPSPEPATREQAEAAAAAAAPEALVTEHTVVASDAVVGEECGHPAGVEKMGFDAVSSHSAGGHSVMVGRDSLCACGFAWV